MFAPSYVIATWVQVFNGSLVGFSAARVVVPITFLGCIYYPWRLLAPIRWLQVVVLVNPLVYMCEGFRLSLTSGIVHMPVWAIYAGMIFFTVALSWVGIDGFRRRVLS